MAPESRFQECLRSPKKVREIEKRRGAGLKGPKERRKEGRSIALLARLLALACSLARLEARIG